MTSRSRLIQFLTVLQIAFLAFMIVISVREFNLPYQVIFHKPSLFFTWPQFAVGQIVSRTDKNGLVYNYTSKKCLLVKLTPEQIQYRDISNLDYFNKIPASVFVIFVNFCLVSCIWMEKLSFDYWKWREEKTGRFLVFFLNIFGTVSWDIKFKYKNKILLCHKY